MPLGLALGFYRAQVEHLDIARFDRKHELGTTDGIFETLPLRRPSLSNVIRKLDACGMAVQLVSLGLLSFAGPQVVLEGVMWRWHKGTKGFLGAIAC